MNCWRVSIYACLISSVDILDKERRRKKTVMRDIGSGWEVSEDSLIGVITLKQEP